MTTPASPATLNGQERELFRIGDYTSLGKGKYTAEDMQGIVARYSADSETPIAIGHIQSDSDPAYGWIKSLRFSGDTLYGTPHQVTPELDELHRQKKYRNVSVSFARNKDGEMYLHHVAVLGAVAPEVRGLKPAKFSADPYEEIEGASMSQEDQKKAIGEGIREFFSSLFKPSEGTSDQEAMIARATQAVEAKFSAQLDVERAARAASEACYSTHQANAATAANQLRADKAVADLKAAGAWVPAYEKLGVPQFFSALSGNDELITFSNASGVEQKPNLLDAAIGIFSAVGRIVPNERKVQLGAAGEHSAALPEANGASVDPDSVTFSTLVSARMTEKNIPYTEAYRQLSAEGKRPVSGASAAGAV